MIPPRVLSVGQCGFDHARISQFLRDAFGAVTIAADSAEMALAALRSDRVQVVLVNRVFDGDGGSGLDLIRSIKSDPGLSELPTILVSNYDDAQARAVSLGALPGFGKAQLSSAKARAALDPLLKLAESR